MIKYSDLDTEKTLLATAWIKADFSSISDLKPKDFYFEDNRKFFELIQQNKREHIDVIAQKSQKSIANIAVVLLNLEIKGLIKKSGGNVFSLA